MKTATKKVEKGKVIIAGKEYKIPQSWYDITLRKFIELRKYGDLYDEAEFLSTLIGCDLDFILNNEDYDFEYDIFKQIEWYRTKPFNLESVPLPKTIKIGDKEFKVPKDIGYKTYGQKIALQEKLKINDIEDPVEIIPYAIAVYFYQEFYETTKFPDDEQIEKFIEEYCLDCSVVEAYPVGYFFLLRFVESMKSKIELLEQNILPKRKKRRLINLKDLVNFR